MNTPKVLIIGQPFNNDTGGGITLSNLFAGWSTDKLAVACSGYLLLDNIDTTVCNTYYQLGKKEHKWSFPFNYIKRKYSSGLVKFGENKIQNLTVQKSKFRVKLIMDYFYPVLEYFGASHVVQKIDLSSEFCDWLNEFNPDVIYAQASSRAEILFCTALQEYLKKPLVFHMMDDWPSTISYKGLLKKFWSRKIDREFKKLLDKCSLLMSISEYMAEEYKARYGKDFITFHNPINVEFWKKYQRNTFLLSNTPSILYAGRIGLGIEGSLELIAKAVQVVNSELQLSISFILQTAEKPLWISSYSCVKHQGFSHYNELPKIFAEADFLILPYDFSPKSIKYIQYSMPTKAPEYMMSGTPIIIFAPEETGIAKYAKKYEWAKVITENSISKLSEAIKELVQHETTRRQIAKKAISIAEEKFDSFKVTNDFKIAISSLIIRV